MNRYDEGRGDGARRNGRDGGRERGRSGRERGASQHRGQPNSGQRGRGEGDRSGDRRSRGNAPRAEIAAARLVAYDVLRDVQDREAYANLALPARIRDAGLDGRDAALATELVAGALRWRGRYDRIIALAAGRDVADIDSRTLNVLRLGAHQLLGMRTAAHAAVNESVELQRRVANKNAAGFVNGVLRSIGRASGDEWDQRLTDEASSPDEAIAARTAHPAWVVRALRDALKLEGRADELDALLDADNRAPRVSLAVLPGHGVLPVDLGSDDAQGDAWGAGDSAAEAVEAAEAAGASTGALTVSGPSPFGLELAGGDPARATSGLGLGAGVVRVQDQGSQLAALALTRAREAVPGERWLDLCAGPGGKTAMLAAEAAVAGATVRANEVSEHRAELVRRSIVANADVVEVVTHDGRDDDAFGGSDARFDRIMVDAPCSGLGALRRRPEARWRKQPSDLPVLTSLQSELLDAAVAHLAPGGLLAYVTCSPHLAETRVAVNGALKRHPGLVELDAKEVLRDVARVGIDLAGDRLSAQLWPHRHGTDAMFVALFTLAGDQG